MLFLIRKEDALPPPHIMAPQVLNLVVAGLAELTPHLSQPGLHEALSKKVS